MNKKQIALAGAAVMIAAVGGFRIATKDVDKLSAKPKIPDIVKRSENVKVLQSAINIMEKAAVPQPPYTNKIPTKFAVWWDLEYPMPHTYFASNVNGTLTRRTQMFVIKFSTDMKNWVTLATTNKPPVSITNNMNKGFILLETL
jgi:hypothetical protein